MVHSPKILQDLYQNLYQRGAQSQPEISANQKLFGYRAQCIARVVEEHCPKLSRADLVLDLGCGAGSFFPIIQKISKSTIGLDFSANALRECKQNKNYTTLLEASFGSLPIANNSISLILLLDSITGNSEGELKALFSEIFRILKPSGVLVFENSATGGKLTESLRFLLLAYRTLKKSRGSISSSRVARIFNSYKSIRAPQIRGLSWRYPSRRKCVALIKEAKFELIERHDKKVWGLFPRQRIILTCRKS